MKTAKAISIIGHPIFHPTWMMIIMLLSGVTRFMPANDWLFLSITFAMTCLVPGVVIVMMKRWKVISSLEMENRDDRPGPLFIMILFLYAAIRFFSKIQILVFFNFYLTSVLAVTALAFIISFFWKISLHAMGWGNLAASLFVMTTMSLHTYLPYFIGSIILTGIVLSARLKLKSHSNAQIYAGLAMGFFSVIIMYFFLLI